MMNRCPTKFIRKIWFFWQCDDCLYIFRARSPERPLLCPRCDSRWVLSITPAFFSRRRKWR